MKRSECCGAAEIGNSSDTGICPECKEHCEYYDEDDVCEDCGELDCRCNLKPGEMYYEPQNPNK